MPTTSRPLEATVTVRMAESGGRAVERKITLPVAPEAAMIGVKPAFSGRSLDDGANADFDVVMVAPDGKTLDQKGLHYELLRVETSYQWYRAERQLGIRADQAHRSASPTARSTSTADKPARISLPVKWGRYRLEVSTAEAERPDHLDHLRRRLLRGIERRHARPAGDRARQERTTGPATP